MEGDYFAAVAISQSEEESLLDCGGIQREERFRVGVLITGHGIEDVVRSKRQIGELTSQRPDLRAYAGGWIYRHQPAPA